MAGIERRLEALEERAGQLRAFTSPPHYLIRHLLETIRVHKWGRSVYQATDRELNTVGMLVAANEFPYGVGVYTFPSGVTVTLTRTEDGESIQAEGSGRLEVEDLPEGLRPYFERMDPAKQPERERRLQELLGGGDGA